jgi:hypothetical protein
MLFTCIAPHTKSKGLPIDDPLFSKKTYTFYMRSTAFKKQGALDRRSLIQQKETYAFTRVRTKSKGIPIGGPLFRKNLFFLHV